MAIIGRLLVVSILLSGLTALSYAQQFVSGPLFMPSSSPFQILRFNYIHESPYLIPQGSWRVIGTVLWANMWAQSNGKRGNFIFDEEQLNINLHARYAFYNWLEAGFDIPLDYSSGGAMDGFIEGFHETLGMGMMRRNDFPPNERHVEITHQGRTTVIAHDDEIYYFRQIYFDSKIRIFDGSRGLPLALKFLMKIPIDGTYDLKQINGWDAGWGLSTEASLARWCRMTASLAASYFENNNFDGISFSPTQISVNVAVNFIAGKGTIITQFQRSSPITTNLGMDLDHSIFEVMFGYRRYLKEKVFYEIGLIENIIHFENSADLGFHFGIGARFN
jgi:hypothetical protein